MAIFIGSATIVLAMPSNNRGVYTANEATIPAAGGAGVTSRNGHALVAFDATTDESAIFSGAMWRDYDPTKVLSVRLFWAAATAVLGAVKWLVAWEAIAPAGQDLDADGFAAPQTATTTCDPTNGVCVETVINFSQAQADGITPTTPYRLRVTRDADDPADDMAGDSQLLIVEIDQL